MDLGESTPPTAAAGPAKADVVVGASGNLANVYFLARDERLPLEAIDAMYPGLVERLAAHPGIGFILARSTTVGPVVIGRSGVHHLADDRVDGIDPLADFGPRAADHLRRLDGFAHVGDLLVNSMYDRSLEEVAAFEELVGSHGGFGGPQTQPFLLAPTRLSAIAEPLIGAPAVHRQLVRWADELGVGPRSGATEAPRRSDVPRMASRGIVAVATLTGLASVLWLLIGALILVGGVVEGATVPAAAGAVATALGLGGLAASIGLIRRRGWAWTAAVLFYAMGVVQSLGALLSGGLSGLASIGVVGSVISIAAFFYLTRPYVRATFRHPRT